SSAFVLFLLCLSPRPPRPTLFPYTTLFRSARRSAPLVHRRRGLQRSRRCAHGGGGEAQQAASRRARHGRRISRHRRATARTRPIGIGAKRMTTTEPLFNPFAPGFTDNPYPHYDVLREQAPVYQHRLGFCILTRYDDVAGSLRGGHSGEPRNTGPGPMPAPPEPVYGAATPVFPALSMLARDPPDHTRLRRPVWKAFTRRSIEERRPHIERLV